MGKQAFMNKKNSFWQAKWIELKDGDSKVTLYDAETCTNEQGW